MALTTNTQVNSESIAQHAVGTVVTDAGAAVDTSFKIGFVPRKIRWVNATDRIVLEWFNGMGSASLRTVAVGTVTLDVVSFITCDLTQANSGFSFKILAADIPASKSFFWEAV